MRFRIIPGAIAIMAILFLVETGCTKLDTTSLGTELIPAIDNINTFADTFNVISTQGYFNDSSQVTRDDYNALGKISNDPLFGKTTANIFLQLKPTYYPFLLSPADTLLGLDSVVLALSYKGTFGDTTIPQHIEVKKIIDNNFRDSLFKMYPVSYAPAFSTLLGSADVNIPSLKNKVYFAHGKDSATYQIRIKLTDDVFNNALYTADTGITALNKAFRNDSLFRFAFNGLALLANGTGNGLMYIGLTDPNTRLEVHFRKSRNGIKDTLYSSLRVAPSNGSIVPSVTANNIIRDRTGSPSASPSPDFNYLQTSPGTFVNISIPGLIPFRDTARIIHRATLLVNQVTENPFYDSIFTPPSFLYADLKDSTPVLNYKPLYTDLNPSAFYNPDNALSYFPATVDNNYFDGKLKYKYENLLGRYATYTLNLSRTIQRMIDKKGYNFDLRLYAPFSISYPQYNVRNIPYLNQIALGRVRVASGSYPDPKLRMKLVVIWSKVKK